MVTLDVLIVAPNDDLHARAVIREVGFLGRHALLVDSADFPEKIVLDYSHDSTESTLSIKTEEGQAYELTRESSVWWRRPRPHSVEQSFYHPKIASFAARESRSFFLGALQAMGGMFVNCPAASDRARLKALQLRVAESLGFKTPRTLLTNDPHKAREFVGARLKKCVYKTFTGTDFGFFETRLADSAEDISELWRLRKCPIILQEHIDGDLDLRATVVGETVFCAAIDFKHGVHGVDSRVDHNPTFAFPLSRPIIDALVGMTRAFGLIYAAIDLRYSEKEGFTFFELNPEGQYLWTEIHGSLPISAALAEMLTRTGAAVRGHSYGDFPRQRLMMHV